MRKHYTSALSALFGKFASKRFSPAVQRIINRGYVKLMGLDMQEFREPEKYETLNALFTRPLERPRAMPEDSDSIISPVDALITECGEITQGKAYQIKGMAYDIQSLFGEHHRDAATKLEDGYFANFYLSPKDYHRYHMPMRLHVRALTHIPGKLYPVNMPLLKHKRDLFIENERVVLECSDDNGALHVLVLVGALNVGKMVVTFEPEVRTNSDIRTPRHYVYEGVTLERGELLGWFEMGSTVLLFSQRGYASYMLEAGQKVKFADMIGTLKR
jgi:phosphatidylserine decarboxylase